MPELKDNISPLLVRFGMVGGGRSPGTEELMTSMISNAARRQHFHDLSSYREICESITQVITGSNTHH